MAVAGLHVIFPAHDQLGAVPQRPSEAQAHRDAVDFVQTIVGTCKRGKRLAVLQSHVKKVGGGLVVIPNMGLKKTAFMKLPTITEVDGLRADAPIIRKVAQAETE